VGHTHEDIDGCFGTIIQTPQGYKEEIEKAFAGSTRLFNLKCTVVDVLVVPNYQLFFSSSIDPHFGRTHKLKWTQHQYCLKP
jgi:hypothetical protein